MSYQQERVSSEVIHQEGTRDLEMILVLLRMASENRRWSSKQPISFAGTTFDKDRIGTASRDLMEIGAINIQSSHLITPIGRYMLPLLQKPNPLQLRPSAFVATGLLIAEPKAVPQFSTLGSALSTEKPITAYPGGLWEMASRAHARFQIPGGSDLDALFATIAAMERVEEEADRLNEHLGLETYARTYFLSLQAYDQMKRIRSALERRLEQCHQKPPAGGLPFEEAARLAALVAYGRRRLLKPGPVGERYWEGRDGFQAGIQGGSCAATADLAIGVGLVLLPGGKQNVAAMVPVTPQWVVGAVEKYRSSYFEAMPASRESFTDHGYDSTSGSVLCRQAWHLGSFELGGKDRIVAPASKDTCAALSAAVERSAIKIALSDNLRLLEKAAARSNGKLPTPSRALIANWLRQQDFMLGATDGTEFHRLAAIESWGWDKIQALTGMSDIEQKVLAAQRDFPDTINLGGQELPVTYAWEGRIDLALSEDQAFEVLFSLSEADRPVAWADRQVWIGIEGTDLRRPFETEGLDRLRCLFSLSLDNQVMASVGDDLKTIAGSRLLRTILVDHPDRRETVYVVAAANGPITFTNADMIAGYLRCFIEAVIRKRLDEFAWKFAFAFSGDTCSGQLDACVEVGAKLLAYGGDSLPTVSSLECAITGAQTEYQKRLAMLCLRRDQLRWQVMIIGLYARDCGHGADEEIAAYLDSLGFRQGRSADRELPSASTLDTVEHELQLIVEQLPTIGDQLRTILELRAKEADFEQRLKRVSGEAKTTAWNKLGELRKLRERKQFADASASLARLEVLVQAAEAKGSPKVPGAHRDVPIYGNQE